jgi:hypothetical protein
MAHNEQEILARIEFLPIKCRIQKAKENFRKYQKDLQKDKDFWWRLSGGPHKPKIKVDSRGFLNFEWLTKMKQRSLA